MTVLCIMQNQWFRDPDRVKRIYARLPHLRRSLIARFLFAGCRTGQILKAVFGERINEFVWEEASPEIGGESNSSFPADLTHLRTVIEEVKPDIVLAFGRVAGDALEVLVPADRLIVGPHPTARSGDVMPRLRLMVKQLEERT